MGLFGFDFASERCKQRADWVRFANFSLPVFCDDLAERRQRGTGAAKVVQSRFLDLLLTPWPLGSDCKAEQTGWWDFWNLTHFESISYEDGRDVIGCDPLP
jgi:hypothetical protein